MEDLDKGIDDDDVLKELDKDIIINVLKFLDTPSDLAHVACVSRAWNTYVSEGGLWREICSKCFPEVQKFKCIVEASGQEHSLNSAGSTQSPSLCLEKASRVYSHLLCELRAPPMEKSCIREPLSASSTDDFPRESIAQTLVPRSMYADGETASYWSSEGQSRQDVPETLTYALVSDLCVVHEVKIRPFLAYFQEGNPIYSAESVRFRFGYSRTPRPCWSGLLDCLSENPRKVDKDEYVWTYESHVFPMAQENILQTFKFPRPVLCIGDVFQIEFMGRVQTQRIDGLYYICVSYVSVCGSPILDFKFEALDGDAEYLLKYSLKREKFCFPGNMKDCSLEENAATGSPRWLSLPEPLRQLRTRRLGPWSRPFFDMLLWNLAVTGLLAVDDEGLEDDMEVL